MTAFGHPPVSTRFDSTILISHLRGDPRATEVLVDAVDKGAFAGVVSRAEIEGGMRSRERADVARLFEGLRLLPVTDAAARRAGRPSGHSGARTPASPGPAERAPGWGPHDGVR